MRRLFALAWTIWLIDFVSKEWALAKLSSEPRKVIGNFLQFTLTKNPGAAFNIATGFTILFSLLALAVVIGVAYVAPRLTSQGWQIAMGLLLGGVLGNLTDRIFREPSFLSGFVIDWIQLPHWPIFNIADSAITIAAILALTLSLRNIAPITRVG